MSRYFTDKFLRNLRPAESKATIDRDEFCPECKYNLRGLPEGHRCPECGWAPGDWDYGESQAGAASGPVKRTPLIDAMSLDAGANRRRWKTALGLACACVVVALVARAVYFGVAITGFGEKLLPPYLVLGLLVSVGWTFATAMMLPPRLGRYWRWVGPLRSFVLWTQWLWILAYVLWLAYISDQSGGQKALLAGQLVLRGIAGLGVIVLAVILAHVAEEAEIDSAARRFNTAAWVLPIVSLLAMALAAAFTGPAGGFTSGPWGGVQFIFILPPLALILAWCWIMSVFALGFLRLRQHTAWSIQYEQMAKGREERIARKRAWLQQQADAKVRPLPGAPDAQEEVIHLEKDVPCPYCGYNLRGLSIGRVCPECGCDPMTHAGFDAGDT